MRASPRHVHSRTVGYLDHAALVKDIYSEDVELVRMQCVVHWLEGVLLCGVSEGPDGGCSCVCAFQWAYGRNKQSSPRSCKLPVYSTLARDNLEAVHASHKAAPDNGTRHGACRSVRTDVGNLE